MFVYMQVCVSMPNNAKVLIDWNTGNGELDFPGWTYSNSAGGSGWKGWERNDGESFRIGWGPRSYNMVDAVRDIGEDNLGSIDMQTRAPSTSTGGSVYIRDQGGPGQGEDKMVNWWFWYDGKPLSQRGVTNSQTDRMSMYYKIEGMAKIPTTGDAAAVSFKNQINLGTYLCWDIPENSELGSPKETAGLHYYHHAYIDEGGAWIHQLFDQTPTHLRGASGQRGWPNNHSFIEHGRNYFEHINQMYFLNTPRQLDQSPELWIDEITFYSTNDTPEPNQNDQSVTSLWIGYWPDDEDGVVEDNDDTWQIGFVDLSFDTYSGATHSTFEIRWSTAPITNTNYASANKV